MPGNQSGALFLDEAMGAMTPQMEVLTGVSHVYLYLDTYKYIYDTNI